MLDGTMLTAADLSRALENDTSLPSLGQRPGALKKRLVASTTERSSSTVAIDPILYKPRRLQAFIPSVTSKFLDL